MQAHMLCYIFYFAAIAKGFISAGVCSENPVISNERHSTPEPAIRGKLVKVKLQSPGTKRWKSRIPHMPTIPLEGHNKCVLFNLRQII